MPTAYPLAWPDDVPRSNRRVRSPFKVSLSRAVVDLKDALRLFAADTGMPVTGVVISSNVTLGQNHPDDPGVAVWFEWDSGLRCIAVDRFPSPEANIRAIYQILEGRRQELRYGGLHLVRATFAGFRALAAPQQRDWREVLGFAADARPTIENVESAYKRMVRVTHPDARGGSAEAFQEVTAARDAARRELVG